MAFCKLRVFDSGMRLLAIGSIVMLSLQTFPKLMIQYRLVWFVIETVFSAAFAFSAGVNLYMARGQNKKPRLVMGILDLVSILGWPGELLILIASEKKEPLTAIRLLRLVRFSRLLRIPLGMEPVLGIFWQALGKSRSALTFLAMYVGLAGVFFSVALFSVDTALRCQLSEVSPGEFTWLLRRHNRPNEFAVCAIQNVLDAAWVVLVTMTTVGYGDVRVVSPGGKIILAIVMLSSMIVLALPPAILSANLIELYLQRKKRRQEPTPSLCE